MTMLILPQCVKDLMQAVSCLADMTMLLLSCLSKGHRLPPEPKSVR